jgi:hypothetical protein
VLETGDLVGIRLHVARDIDQLHVENRLGADIDRAEDE